MPTNFHSLSARVFLPSVLLIALAVPSAASGQATRTWVSGVGDDVNPCSRTAPCKTFAGAISKTATGGEINALDDGGFGAVTITKSITIRSRGHNASILASMTSGIIINTTSNPSARVNIIGLDVNGAGNGLNGIRILQAGYVRIAHVDIHGFTLQGIDIQPTNNGANNNNVRVSVQDTRVFDIGTPQNAPTSGNGLFISPAAPSGAARVTITDSDFTSSFNGIFVNGASRSARVNLYKSDVGHNANAGVYVTGGLGIVRLGRNVVTDNKFGIAAESGGQMVSYGGNTVHGNDVDLVGSPTGTIAPL